MRPKKGGTGEVHKWTSSWLSLSQIKREDVLPYARVSMYFVQRVNHGLLELQHYIVSSHPALDTVSANCRVAHD